MAFTAVPMRLASPLLATPDFCADLAATCNSDCWTPVKMQVLMIATQQ
jgi:hypothetical protein